MKSFIKCPKCHRPLLNEAVTTRDGKEVWYKKCISISHGITCVVDDNDEISTIIIVIDVNSHVIANWRMDNETLCVVKGKSVTNIPFFEPDFTDYDKILQKLKTYITFS